MHIIHFHEMIMISPNSAYRYACDKGLITMMRDRSLGNSTTAMMRKLFEMHQDGWLATCGQYFSDCLGFLRNHRFQSVPPLCSLPSAKWLMSVYMKDVIERRPETLKKITSIHGSILKLDSTKK